MAYSRETSSTIAMFEQLNHNNCYNINSFTNSILIEILIRVPDCQSAQQCKSVCKRWLSLVSTPYFVARFVDHHGGGSHLKPGSETFTLLHQYRYFAYHDTELDPRITITTHPVHTRVDAVRSNRSFSLDFLPFGQTADIVAVSADLVICYDRWVSFELLQKGKGTAFYICNLLTKEWMSLPPAPSSYWKSGLLGFITYEANRRKTRDQEFMYDYKLVHIPDTEECCVEIFSSETGEWSKESLNTPRVSAREISITNGVTLRRKLHWIVDENRVLAFDPFDCDNHCRLIDLPNLRDQTRETECLGVWEQHLRVALLVRADRQYRLILWDLRDYDTGEWCLKYNVCCNDIELTRRFLFDHQLKFDEGTCLLACHPNNEAVLYLRCKSLILMCNMQERTLLVISECSKSWTWHLRKERDTAYILEQPCWPSSVPPLPTSSTSHSD